MPKVFVETRRPGTRQGSRRVAAQMETARKTALAKGEVGIRDKKHVPTLRDFIGGEFFPCVQTHVGGKRATLAYYRVNIAL